MPLWPNNFVNEKSYNYLPIRFTASAQLPMSHACHSAKIIPTPSAVSAIHTEAKKEKSEILDGEINDEAFTPVVTKGADLYLKMPRMKYTASHCQAIHSVAVLDVSSIDDTFVVATDERTTYIWSLRFGHFLLDIPSSHKAKISVAAAYVDESTDPLVITGSWDESIHVWSLLVKEAGRKKYCVTTQKRTVLTGHTNRILALKAAKNDRGLPCECSKGPLLVSGGVDCNVRVWSLKSLTYLYTLSHYSIATWILCLDVYYSTELNCSVVICGGKDHSIRFWRIEEPSDQENTTPFLTISDFSSQVIAMAITDAGADNPLVAVIGKNDLNISLYSIHTGKLMRKLVGHCHAITDVASSYSTLFKAHLLVSLSSSHNIRVWSPMTGDLYRTFRGHKGVVSAACLFSPMSETDDLIIVSGTHPIPLSLSAGTFFTVFTAALITAALIDYWC